MTNETTTMDYVALNLWLYFGGPESWEKATEERRRHFRKAAVRLIDNAEPIWRARVDAHREHEYGNRILAAVWEDAIDAARAHLAAGVINEPEEIAGYIDQHWALIGLAKMENPYAP